MESNSTPNCDSIPNKRAIFPSKASNNVDISDAEDEEYQEDTDDEDYECPECKGT